ncbi:MAG: 2Fe-2S iron-sulfur cluster-binding protein [Candidatus Anstonellales archaeon]
MAKVTLKNEGITLEIPDGSNLSILEGKCGVLFACKAGTCGSCLVNVVSGMENLNEPNETEKIGLELFATKPTQRLLCQTIIKRGNVTIEY